MVFVPAILNPFTELAWSLTMSSVALNPDSLCSKLHMKYIDCLEAYGCYKGRDKCAELFYDLNECHKGCFQRLRTNEIRKERMRQYREGKLKQPFDQHPPIDSFVYL